MPSAEGGWGRRGRRRRGEAGEPAKPARRLSAGRAARLRGARAGTWVELSVAADIEAVEAVSEILTRFAPGGTSVEPGFGLTNEGLGAVVDPTKPAIVRAYLPGLDPAGVRMAIAQATTALGHLQAFGLRPIGELQTSLVREADWAEAWKSHFPVLRVGPANGDPADVAPPPEPARRRGPVAGSGHGLRDGATSNHEALPGGARDPRRRGPRGGQCPRGVPAFSTSAAAPASWPSPPASSARATCSASTRIRSPWNRPLQTRASTG
jgi:hypothetical protein